MYSQTSEYIVISMKVCYNRFMNEKTKRTINEIEAVCKNNDVEHLYLFGSFAKGTEQMGSDIDVVVKGVNDYRKLEKDIDDIKTLQIINIFNYDTIKNKYLIEDIDRYAKVIY